MQANLTRLVDLTAELGRRLKPLGRQAEIARRPRSSRRTCATPGCGCWPTTTPRWPPSWSATPADEAAAAAARRGAGAGARRRARPAETELETAEQQHAPRLAAAQDAYFGLSSLSERLRACTAWRPSGTGTCPPPEPQRPGRDPAELEQEAAALREQETELRQRLAVAREQLRRRRRRPDRRRERAGPDRAAAGRGRSGATRRAERLARLRGQVGAAPAVPAAAQDEAGRLAEALAQARTRADHAQRNMPPCRTWSPGGRQAAPTWPPGMTGRGRAGRRGCRGSPAAIGRAPGQRPAGGAAGPRRGADRGGHPRRRRQQRAAGRAQAVQRRDRAAG